jgi:two-component system, NtrC family, sensor kinase
MVRPLSSIIFYTLLFATILFFCGIYFHFQNHRQQQADRYTELTSCLKNQLLEYFLKPEADPNFLPGIATPEDSIITAEKTEYIFTIGNDGIESNKSWDHFSEPDEIRNEIRFALTNNDALSDSGIFTICQLNNVFYFSILRGLSKNPDCRQLALTVDYLPLSARLKEQAKAFHSLNILLLTWKDTLFSTSNNRIDVEIPVILTSPRNKPVEYLYTGLGVEKTRNICITTNMSESIRMIAIYSIDDRLPASIILLISSCLLLLAGSILFPILFKRDLQNQIKEINLVVKSISDKDFDSRISTNYPGELGVLTRSINSMSQQLKDSYHDLEIRVIRRTSEISMRNAELRKNQREILTQNQELKSAYEALKESREKYEKLIEHLEDEYFFYSIAENGTLLFVSPSVKNILGYAVTTYRDLHDQLYTDNPINVLARERNENLRHGVSQPKYLKEIFDIYRQPKILEVSEVPVFNENHQLVSIEGLAHDITERQKAEELIKEQEEKYRMLFTHASDFIFMYELNKKKKKVGQFIEANQYTLDRLGFSIEELRQITPLELIASETNSDADDSIDEYVADDMKFERIWESKNGNIIDVEISTHAFRMKKKDVAIAVARDISDRKRAEQEVRFMNEELVNQKENLEALVDNLTQTQEQLVQSEKMAALGQLIAGIAHEVNTPLGAIKASIGNLSDSLDNALGELPALFQTQSVENLKLFTQLFQLARVKKSELSSREKRQKRKDLSETLLKNIVAEAEVLADLLVYLEIYQIDDGLLSSLKSPDAVRVVKSARNFISLLRNTNTINIAVEKATKVVFALKKYAHRDAIGEKISTDIIDSIETVLTLYNNQLKQGVEVIRNYEKLPFIQCYQDEISQVWTNLIQNAIQAMHLEGTLTIATHLEKDLVWISFKDTGPGIEPDIMDKIFDPFFTTKKQGEGSGLGLDIVKKIIEKHNGSIEVDSKLGEGAKFIIKIPVS